MSMLKGETLTLVDLGDVKKVEWKQPSNLGILGERSQNYQECTYKVSGGGMILVFIQQDYSKPESFVIDSKCQFGMNKGVFFLVIQDQSQTPCQHRFMKNPKQEWLKYAHDLQKQYTGEDMSWIARDYLHNFE